MALGILGLLSEPIWHFHRYKQSQKIIDRFTHFRSATLATRNGLLPRHHLRSQFWHNVDPLLEVTKNKNATLEYDKKASHPRVLFLHFDAKTLEGSYSRQENRHEPRLVQPIGNSSCCGDDTDYHILPFSRRFYEDCVPIIRPRVHPTCNTMHEIALDSDVTFLSDSGSWRTAFKVENHNVVLKMLSLNRAFNKVSMDVQAIDIMAMDHLTASPYVINAHSFCGQSVATEFAPSSGRDFIKQDHISSRERLKMARDLARGLADLHAFQRISDYNGHDVSRRPIVFAHNDINIANTVQVDGVVKWNDFNLGVLLRQQNGTACGSPVLYDAPLWRSPEEIVNASYVMVEKSDMYGFGNILYQVMTRHQPWTHKEPGGRLSKEDVTLRKKEGILPTIPEQYKNTSKPALQALRFATEACYHRDPNKRPTAYELAIFLGKIYAFSKYNKKISSAMIRNHFKK